MSATRTVTRFDDQEIRAAERVLENALSAEDRTAWVYEYTEDAVFDGGGEEVLRGREALLGLAKAMAPMRDVSIRPLRTEGSGHLATVWFEGSWVSGPPGAPPTAARGMILWRKGDDGHWRVAIEHLSGESASQA